MTSVTIVTPWLDCRELIPDYVRAMELAPLYAGDKVWIMDNDSEISESGLRCSLFSEEDARSESPDRIYEVIRVVGPDWEDIERGYVSACNAGIKRATTDAVLFLNNDIKAQAPWLEPLRKCLGPGRLVGANLLTLPHARVNGRPVSYLDGWCLAGMRDDLLELGGFDDGYEEPAYYSDNDLCLRARAAGFKLVAVPIPLVHLGNYTSRLNVERRNKASAKNRERYLKRAEELLCLPL